MSDIKLFSLNNNVQECRPQTSILERELQNIIEQNMELFFGVRLLKSEYNISNGRMDSIGIDENNCPVIFEYKRSQNENVINQGLFYLDWLLDHKGDFRILVREVLGEEVEKNIDWSAPSVICIAYNFTKYDLHAVNQMQRNIKLVRYRLYDNNPLLFDFLNSPDINSANTGEPNGNELHIKRENTYKTHSGKLAESPSDIRFLYDSLCDYIESLGDNISSNNLKYYKAYRTVKNFVCIEIYNKHIALYLALDPKKEYIEEGFTRDMSNIGHHATGNLQAIIKNKSDFEKVKPLILKAYEES